MRSRIAGRLGSPRPPATPAPATPTVSLSKLLKAARTDPPKSGTPVSYGGVETVETALVDEGLLARAYGDGHWGTSTTPAYAKWQRRCGYTGAAADGNPGMASLRSLGLKHGFKVVA